MIAVSLPHAVVAANSRTALIVISGVIAAAGFGLALTPWSSAAASC